MNVICPILWLRILWALTYVGRILLLRIQWITVLHDLSLRNTSWKMYLLLISPNLCIWKFLNSLHHFRNHLHYLNTYRGPCTQSSKGTLAILRGYLKAFHSQCQSDITQGTLPGYLLRLLSLWEINTLLLVYKNTQKTPTFDRNVRKILMFSPHNGKHRTAHSIHQTGNNENHLDFFSCFYQYNFNVTSSA
jgi:hypothetical protein